jgi:ketosteroid isomerase-like protein
MQARLLFGSLLSVGLLVAMPAAAAWKPGSPAIAAAAGDARIAGALASVDAIDRAAVSDDHAAFTALLTDDLAVNNPQNGVSLRGATAQHNAAGQINYASYDRVIDYAGLRAGMVVLMGEEIVVPRGSDAREVHRRFTDVWQRVDGGWKLTVRQATIIARP